MPADNPKAKAPRPSRPRLPVTLHKADYKFETAGVFVHAIFKDADGVLWCTDHLPAFWFDMDLAE